MDLSIALFLSHLGAEKDAEERGSSQSGSGLMEGAGSSWSLARIGGIVVSIAAYQLEVSERPGMNLPCIPG